MQLLISPSLTKNVKIFFIRINFNKCTPKAFFIIFPVFLFSCLLHLCPNDLVHQLLLLIYASKNRNQFLCFKHNFIVIFSPENTFIILKPNDCFLVNIGSRWLIQSLALNLIAAVVLVSIINFITSSTSKNMVIVTVLHFTPSSFWFWRIILCNWGHIWMPYTISKL